MAVADVQVGIQSKSRHITAMVSEAMRNSPEWREWVELVAEAETYYANVAPKFTIRDQNYKEQYDLRHGLVKAYVPPSHKEILPVITSKEAGEILERLVAITTAVYPTFIFQADGMDTDDGLHAAELSSFATSFYLALEDKTLLPLDRMLRDQQLAYGGGMLKVIWRLDRWKDLPTQAEDESARSYNVRVDAFKARNLPFDVIVPEYNTLYYDLTVDGMSRMVEKHQLSVYDAADMFGGRYDDKNGELHIPVEIGLSDDEFEDYIELGYDFEEIPETKTVWTVIKARRAVNYMEYWKRGERVLYVIDGTPVRVEYLEPDEPLPYFLALGMVTSSPDPGRLGLPVLYNAFEDFRRKLNYRAQEDAFLYKHGFARMVHYTTNAGLGTEEPDVGDDDEEEEQIGEILEAEMGKEDWKYLFPANVSALFADAINSVNSDIQNVALADVMTGKTPPSGTTGYLWTNMASAANAKYLPIIQQATRAIRLMMIYVMRKWDTMDSPMVVSAQTKDVTVGPYIYYAPGDLKDNLNLDVQINAPLPDDRITQTEYLAKGHALGFISRRRVQKDGYQVEQPDTEDWQIRLEKFNKFYEPIAMLKAIKRAGRMDELIEAAKQGILPPEIQQLAVAFSAGPDGQAPANVADIVGNPNGIQPVAQQPGLGEPAQPTVGATVNAVPGVQSV